MCEGCYEEAGSPKIWNERVERGVRAVKALYDSPFGSVGGRMHIVTDDWNCDDDNIAFCMNEITGTPTFDHEYPVTAEERECLAAFQAMTEDERFACLGMEAGYWHPWPDAYYGLKFTSCPYSQ